MSEEVKDEIVTQLKLRARLKRVNKGNDDALCFDVRLGFIKLVFIVHIPYEDEATSLVYCKVVKNERPQRRPE